MKTSYVALTGPTNSGKSTLLNCFANKKVSIVSKKIQTTNFNIEFSLIYKNNQIIFIDTPGFYKDRINDNFLREALLSFDRADIVIFILDINNKFRHLDKIKDNIDKIKKKILVFNKIDQVDNTEILKKIKEVDFLNKFDEIFYISALKKKNTGKILDFIEKNSTKVSKKFTKKISKEKFFSEITREALLNYTHKEIPYKSLIVTNNIKSGKYLTINQTIIAKTEAHKKIIIGKNGGLIKKIGIYSRQQLEKIMKKKVNLFLKVKISKTK
ncbi:MAG: GTPase Era [Pelagibacteraceae bacterium]|tara:strand:- start:180 stop:989 length:810 start_codon:yes stop_codon:yes gene_type:complete